MLRATLHPHPTSIPISLPSFLLLGSQWPGTFCRTHPGGCHSDLHPLPQAFTIHGLWPDFGDGSWPQYCDPSRPFDLAALAPLRPALEREWPSLTGPHPKFWAHEWSRHGSCATPGGEPHPVFASEVAYFGTTLDLHHKMRIDDSLKAAGVDPRREGPFATRAVEVALTRFLGATPRLMCVGEDIFEVHFCLDRDLHVLACPAGTGAKERAYIADGPHPCGDKIRFPAPLPE